MFFFSKKNDNKLYNVHNLRQPDYCEFESMNTYFREVKRIPQTDIGSDKIVVVYECMSCNRFLCVEYSTLNGLPNYYNYNFYNPNFPFDETSTEVLNDISPRFINTYKQASIVEKQNLNELDKLSYRKSIEILINDFLKSNGKTDDELIKKTMNEKINMLPHNDLFDRSIPRLISWIGNDGAHVYERHPELTISDMKTIIHTFVLCLTVTKTNEKYSKKADNLKK